PFQLHHTGIKTRPPLYTAPTRTKFQLHHTGIKTLELSPRRLEYGYFNCTIQELKRNLLRISVVASKISIAPYRN
ncbi:hypothetical protein HMPREF1554_02175, partial [Porphyromonas gingivalis F0569]